MRTTKSFSTLNDQATTLLRDRILNGELAPGSRIVETELAEELGLSRGTLRAALQQLSHEGLIVQQRFRSTFVTPLTAQDASEIYTLRNCLEAMAAEHAAERIDTAGAAALEKAIGALSSAVESGDRNSVIDAEFDFHRCIMALSRHSRLQEHYRIIEQQTRLYLRMTAILPYRLSDILKVHKELAKAIQIGDASLAARLAQNHSTADGERMIAYLKDSERKGNDVPL